MSVDLPTLGRPTMATSGSVGGDVAAAVIRDSGRIGGTGHRTAPGPQHPGRDVAHVTAYDRLSAP